MTPARPRIPPPAFALVTLLAGAALLAPAACDNKSPSKPPTTKENPSTILGKSAQMGRDLKASIQAQQANTAAMADAMQGGKQTTIGGLAFTVPPSWQTVPPAGSMRAAEFKITPEGASDSVSVVFYTIPGGDADSNITRWASQMKGPGGAPVIPLKKKISVAGLNITTAALEGTYSGMGPSGQPTPPQDGVRFVGAIIEGGPSGPIQVRLLGPRPAVEAVEATYIAMLESAQKP